MPAIRLCLAGAIAVVVFARAPLAQQRPEALRTQSLDVSDNLYLVSGGGGNGLLMTGDDGVVLVDAKRQGFGRSLREVASGISDQPVTTVIYTHAHADHTGGGIDLGNIKRIVAHENAAAAMARMDPYRGPGAAFLPNTTFKDTLSMGAARDRIELHYYGSGHTNGDTVVVFPGKRVAYLGDLFPGKSMPVVDAANGGSLVAWPDTLARAAAELKGITRIIPGHAVPPPGSPLGRWITVADLQEYVTFTRELVQAARTSFEAGKPLDAAVSELRLAERYPAYDFAGVREAVQAIYAELKK